MKDECKKCGFSNEYGYCTCPSCDKWYAIAINYDKLEKYKEAYDYYKKYSNSAALDDEYKQYAKTRVEELKKYADWLFENLGKHKLEDLE